MKGDRSIAEHAWLRRPSTLAFWLLAPVWLVAVTLFVQQAVEGLPEGVLRLTDSNATDAYPEVLEAVDLEFSQEARPRGAEIS